MSKRALILLFILVFLLGLGGGYAISKFSLLERVGLITGSAGEPGAGEESGEAGEESSGADEESGEADEGSCTTCDGEEEPGEEEEEGAEEEVEEAYTCKGQIYLNKNQGYKVCYSNGWYTQVFESPKKVVGFDPNPIPEASEYGGVFMISISNKNLADLNMQYSADLSSPSSTTATVDGVTGVRLSGTIPSDSFFFASYQEVFTMVQKFSRTYVIQLLSSPSEYAANLALYNKFVNSFRFLGSASSSP